MPSRLSPLAGTSASRLVDALGAPEFGARLIGLLGDAAGAVYCGAYRFGRGRFEVLSAAGRDGTDVARGNAARYERERFWQRDWALAAADDRTRHAAGAQLIRVDPSQIADAEFREYFFRRPGIEEKLLFAGRRGDDAYGVAVFRTGRRFSRDAVERLSGIAEFLLSCCAKHSEALRARREACGLLASPAGIEERLQRRHPALTRREAQVCSRILSGFAVEAIAADLGIRPESVATYRKRAFQRMGIGSRHQLLRELIGAL
jgi:DNA-binding CsgD family transcriptional regulator